MSILSDQEIRDFVIRKHLKNPIPKEQIDKEIEDMIAIRNENLIKKGKEYYGK